MLEGIGGADHWDVWVTQKWGHWTLHEGGRRIDAVVSRSLCDECKTCMMSVDRSMEVGRRGDWERRMYVASGPLDVGLVRRTDDRVHNNLSLPYQP